jgi:hypothetical protein
MRRFLWPIVCAALALPAVAQTTTSAPATKTEHAVWAALSTRKVFKDDLPPDSTPASLRLTAGRGEAESAQLVIRSSAASSIKAVEVSPLKADDGRTLPGGCVDLLRVVYVNLPEFKKDYPDPLPPLTLPLDLRARENQPIWIRLTVPADAQAGNYRGQVALTFGDDSKISVPLLVTVWPIDIPRKPSMRTAFGLSDNWIALQHGVQTGSPEHQALHARYWECLVAHRISPYSIPVDVFSPEAGKYLGDERLSCFVIPYSDDEAQLRKTVDHLRANGWLAKGYFYVVDEPKDAAQYDRLKEVCRKIHAIDPKLRIVSPFFCNAEFGEKKTAYELLVGHINIWCPNTQYFKPEPMAARKRAGEEPWWYVCCGPGEPYANFFVELAGMSHRMLMWQQKKFDVEGLLYWSTTYWNPASTKDPWADMATVKDINAKIYGDGSLLYPGKKVGVDGPVTSVRLEIIRDGLEDYEYLTQFEQRYGRDRAQQMIARVVTSMTEFERDPQALELLRAEIAGALTAGPRPERAGNQ